jgi:addiction module HigA family antidote
MSNILIHPGEHLNDEIKCRGISQIELSVKTGISKTILNEIINGKRNINASYAIAFEQVLGTSAIVWLNLQTSYDISVIKSKNSK